MSDDARLVANLALLVCGALSLLAVMAFRPAAGGAWRRGLSIGLGLVAVLSVAAYFKYGALHGYGRYGRHLFHYHDIWHYVVGAKYYPEVGYARLYDCTAVALRELGEEGVAVPEIPAVRVLQDPMTWYSPIAAPSMAESCHTRFTDARWAEFKADQRVWLDFGFDPGWWRVMLFDLGFNPPPSWNVIGHTLVELVPLSRGALELLPLLDVALVFAVAGALVYRAWGGFALTSYLLVLGTNPLASFPWTGGSYARQLWFGFLVSGLALTRLERWRLAGVLLGLATAMRIFPVVFLVGAVVALVVPATRDPRARKALVDLVGAAGLTLAGMVGLSLVMFDPTLWGDFYEKISQHGATFFPFHVGFEKWAVWTADMSHQDFHGTKGLATFAEWNQRLAGVWEHWRVRFELIRGGLVLSALLLSLRRSSAEASLLFGGTAMFCYSMPANYYYLWLAAVPAVWFSETAGRAALARMAALFLAIGAVAYAPFASPDGLTQNAIWNQTLMAWFVVWIGTVAAEDPTVLAVVGGLGSRVRARPLAAGVAALAALAIGSALRLASTDRRPNLVLVVVDTLRADRLGAYGYPRATSPNLDALAASGTLFEQARSHAPWTAPSVASIMTSLTPHEHGLVSWNRALAPERLTLAEHLQDQGYQTFAVASHVIFRRQLGFQQGFERFDTTALELGHPERAVSSGVVTERALKLVDERRDGQPFFLWAHYFDPHNDYVPHQGRTFETPGAQTRVERWSDAYDSEVNWTDHHVGKLVAALERRGLSENTVIAVVADHGEEFMDHGGTNHAFTLFDELVHVPMIVRAPGIRPGRVAEVVPTSDLAPTLLSVMGVPIPDAFGGRAVPVVGGAFASEGHRPVHLETERYADKRGIVEWPYKVVVDRALDLVHLYDLAADPAERVDLADDEPAVTDRLLRRIEEHYGRARTEAPVREQSAEEQAELEALGYTEP